MISFAKRFVKRSRSASVAVRRHRAIGVALESLESRILFTWIGATSGNTNNAAHQYNNVANWSSGVIEDSFAGATFTANTTLFFTASHTTGAGGLNLGYSGNFNLTLMSSSTTTWTLTLGGNIFAAPANQTVTIGDVAGADDVDIALGAAGRTFTTASGQTLAVVNPISGATALTAAGTGTLTLSGINTYSGGTTLSSGQLDMNSARAIGTGAFTINGGTIDNTSGAAVTLTSNQAQTWGADFTFLGTNALNLGTGGVTLGANRIVTVSASILTEGGIIAGAFSLTKAGAGTMTLSGADTFSGGTTLSAGQLNVNSAKSVGTGTFTINGGTIDNTSGALVTLSNNNVQTWGGDFTFVGSNALNLGTGAVTLGASRTVTVSASTLTAGGAIGDGGNAFSLTKSGAGELAVTAAGTYTGGTTINAGILSFANGALGTGNITFGANSTLQWNGANTQDISGKIQAIASGVTAIFDTNGNNVTLASALGGSGGITKVGAGALTLSGANTFQGGLTLTTGSVNINNATALGTGTFTISSGTTLNNTSGGLITLSNNNAQTWSGSFTFTGTNALNLGTGAVTLGANCTATVTASTLTIGGAIGDGGSGFLLTKVGGGTLTLPGNNTFSGGMTLTAGTLDVNSATAVGSGTFTINGGTIDNTSGAAITLSNNNVLTWGASFTFTGTNSLNLGTGTLTLGAAVTVSGSASMLTVGGAIGDGGSGFKITKGGVGTLTLSGNNTFSGGMTLAAGQLNINSATAIGTGTFTLSGGNFDNTSGSAITLSNNNAISWTQNFTFVGSNALNLGTGAVTMATNRTITTTASTLTIGGAIGDGGNGFKATKTGAGTLTLSGNNTFSGGTTLTTGQLNINSATAVGSGLLTISAGTIDNTSGAAITLSNNNTGSWGGNFTFIGSNNLNLGTGAVALTGSPTVTINGGMLSDGGIISGNKALTEAGAGTLTLSGVNTFSAGMTLAAGQLNINNAAAVGASTFAINGGTIDNTSGAAITLSNNNVQSWGGSFTFVGSNNLNLGIGAVALTGSRTVTINSGMLTVGGIIAGAHTLTEAGSGTLTLSGPNTYSTGMTLTSGQLNINNAKAVGTSTFTINGGMIDNTSGAPITLFNNNVQTWGGDFTFVGSNALNLGTGAVTLSANRTVTISGSTLTEGGIIGGAFSLTKAGVGTLAVTGSNTFSAGLIVSAGTLLANDAAGSGTGSGAVTVNSSGTLGGTGTASGAVTVNSGGTLAPGNGATTSVFNTGNLILASGADLDIVLNGNTAGTGYDQVNVTGTVNVTGSTLALSGTRTAHDGTLLTIINNDAADAIVGTFSGLAEGGTTIFSGVNYTATYIGGTGNDAVLTADLAATTTAVASSANPSVVGQAVTFTATVSSTATGTPTGTVTFLDGVTTLGMATLNGSGIATLGTSALTLGSHSITVVYGGDTNFTTSTSSALSQTVNQAATTSSVASSANPSVSGQSVTFTATVATSAPGTGIPTGMVTFKDGATTLGTGTLNGSGQTTFSTSALSVGSHSITVVYAGDTNYTTSNSSALTQTVNQAATTSSVASSANPSVSGQSVTFTATVAASAPGSGTPTGTVTFKDGATTLGTGTLNGSGQTTFSTSALSVGSHSITVAYAGDTDFATSTSSALSQTVNQSATTSSVASSANPSVSGQSVTFTATVAASAPGAGIPTGTVTFKDGGTTLGTGSLDGSGQTTFSTSALSVGSHSITIVYAGDTNFTTSTSSTLSQTVNQSATTSSVASSANPSVFGESVTFTATIAASAPGAGVPTGTVTFMDGVTSIGSGTLDGSGQTTFSTSALSVGSHSITVVYAGDTDFTTSTSSSLSQTVNQAATTSSVASSANPAVFGQSVTFTATVAASAPGAGIPTGTVTFMDGVTSIGSGTLDGSGQTTLSTSALSVGSHSITVVYAGDTDFTTSTSSALSQTVNQSATTSSVASSANPSVFGQSVTFTATVAANSPGSGIPTGTVTFKDGATTLGAGTLDGSGQTTFSTSAFSVGGHSITVVYGGDTDFTTSTSAALSQTVNQSATTSSIASSANPSVFGQSVTFTATVAANAPGSGIPTGTVLFKDGATTLGAGSLDGSGQTTFSTSALSVGSHSITIVYGGDTNYTTSASSALSQTVNQSATTSSVASSANPSVFGQSVTFTATVAASAPGAGIPTGTVTFNDGATTLGTGTLDGSGQTTFSTSALSIGSHSITVVYADDTNFTTSTSSALSQTVNQSATTSSVASSANPSVFGQSVTFTATVAANAPGSGTPTGTVTFMDGSTSLGTGTLDGSGQTTLSTSALSVGSHPITIVYGGDTNFTTSTSSSLSQTVNQAATTSLVASSANPAVFGQSVTFTATVAASAPGAGIPTGTVIFMDGVTSIGSGTLDGSGQTTLSTSALSVGSHSITVVYAGDTNFTTSTSSTLTQTVNQSATTTGVASSAAPSVVGQSVTFTATVSATAPGSGTSTGTVTFEDGSTVLGTDSLNGSGIATFSISSLVLGSHSITAIYAGDANFTTSTSSALAQTVNQDSTTSAVISAPEPVAFSRSVMFTGTVTADAPGAGTPTGTLTFKDGSTTLGSESLDGSGQATLSLSSLTLGLHSITVVYSGDSNFTGSTSSVLSESVDQTPPSMVVFDQQPTSATAGVTISPDITVDVEDPFGNIVASDSSDVTLSVATGSGSLLGTVTVAAVNGVATFTGLSLDAAGSYTLSATDGTLAGATSNSFTTSPAAASKIAFVQQPTNATAGNAISPSVTVGVEDQFGNIVTTDNSNVTLSVATGPSALLGTLAVAAQNGVATFNNLSLNTDGSYTLSAADGSLSSAASSSFTVSPEGTPSTLAVAQQPTTATAGSDPASAMVIQVKDHNGNVITGFDSQVSLSIISGPTGGALAGTPVVTAVNGVATFSDINITHAGTYVLAASINGGIVAESTPIQIDPGPATQNLVMQQPSPSWQYGAITPIVVNVTDQYDNPVTVPGGTITAALSSGPAGATLTGTTTVPAIGGQAAFTNLSVNIPGMYTLIFTSSGDSPAVTESFEVVSIPTQRFLFNGSPNILEQQRRNAPAYINLGPPLIAFSFLAPSQNHFSAAPPVVIDPQSFLNAISSLDPSLLNKLLD